MKRKGDFCIVEPDRLANIITGSGKPLIRIFDVTTTLESNPYTSPPGTVFLETILGYRVSIMIILIRV